MMPLTRTPPDEDLIAAENVTGLLRNKFARAGLRCFDMAEQERLLDLGWLEFTVTAPEGERVLKFWPALAYPAIQVELDDLWMWAWNQVQVSAAPETGSWDDDEPPF